MFPHVASLLLLSDPAISTIPIHSRSPALFLNICQVQATYTDSKSIHNSVLNSIRYSIYNSVLNSIRYSIHKSILNSLFISLHISKTTRNTHCEFFKLSRCSSNLVQAQHFQRYSHKTKRPAQIFISLCRPPPFIISYFSFVVFYPYF